MCCRNVHGGMMNFPDMVPFDPLSFEAQLALQSQASRRPPTYPQPHPHVPFQARLVSTVMSHSCWARHRIRIHSMQQHATTCKAASQYVVYEYHALAGLYHTLYRTLCIHTSCKQSGQPACCCYQKGSICGRDSFTDSYQAHWACTEFQLQTPIAPLCALCSY